MKQHPLHDLQKEMILTFKKIYIISASLIRDATQPIRDEIKRMKRRRPR